MQHPGAQPAVHPTSLTPRPSQRAQRRSPGATRSGDGCDTVHAGYRPRTTRVRVSIVTTVPVLSSFRRHRLPAGVRVRVGTVPGRPEAAEPAAALLLGYRAPAGPIAVTAVHPPGQRRAAPGATADIIASSRPQRRGYAALPTTLESWNCHGVDAQTAIRARELDRTYPAVDTPTTHLSPDSRYPPGRPGPATYLRLDRDEQRSRRRRRPLQRPRQPPPDTAPGSSPWIVQHMWGASILSQAHDLSIVQSLPRATAF
jgi:hypothetical protein